MARDSQKILALGASVQDPKGQLRLHGTRGPRWERLVKLNT